MKARRKRRRRIFHIFGSQDPSDFLVVTTLRWDRTLGERIRGALGDVRKTRRIMP